MPIRGREVPTKRFRHAAASKAETRGDPDDPRWHLVQRIAVSRSLGRSPLLSDFLLYVCDRHLRDKTSELTEQRIGVKVFGRAEGYNSNDDNIVRNYARMLRKRVDDYFANEGRDEHLLLEIPRGRYVPIFTPRLPAVPSSRPSERVAETGPHALLLAQSAPGLGDAPGEPETVTAINEIVAAADLPAGAPANAFTRPRIPKILIWSTATVLLLTALAFVAGRSWRLGNRSTAAGPLATDALWSQLFQSDRDTFIVPADSGLVILQGLTRQPVALGEYAAGSYRVTAAPESSLPVSDINELGTRRYTSIVDLNLVSHLSRLPQVVPERMLIRFARDLRMDDLRSGNAILLGSVDSNPWDELFEQELNFRFVFSPKSDTAPTILNQHPKPGERAVYANRHIGAWHNTFAVVAYVPNLDGTGHVLMIGGLNMAGTQAAGDFMLNPELMKPTLEHARGANGVLRPFELLIETDNVAANASRPHIVSERIGLP